MQLDLALLYVQTFVDLALVPISYFSLSASYERAHQQLSLNSWLLYIAVSSIYALINAVSSTLLLLGAFGLVSLTLDHNFIVKNVQLTSQGLTSLASAIVAVNHAVIMVAQLAFHKFGLERKIAKTLLGLLLTATTATVILHLCLSSEESYSLLYVIMLLSYAATVILEFAAYAAFCIVNHRHHAKMQTAVSQQQTISEANIVVYQRTALQFTLCVLPYAIAVLNSVFWQQAVVSVLSDHHHVAYSTYIALFSSHVVFRFRRNEKRMPQMFTLCEKK